MNTEYSDLPMLRDLLFNVGLDHVKRETNAYYSKFCKCPLGVFCILPRPWMYKSLCCGLFKGSIGVTSAATPCAESSLSAFNPSAVSAAVVIVSASLWSWLPNTAVSIPGQPIWSGGLSGSSAE